MSVQIDSRQVLNVKRRPWPERDLAAGIIRHVSPHPYQPTDAPEEMRIRTEVAFDLPRFDVKELSYDFPTANIWGAPDDPEGPVADLMKAIGLDGQDPLEALVDVWCLFTLMKEEYTSRKGVQRRKVVAANVIVAPDEAQVVAVTKGADSFAAIQKKMAGQLFVARQYQERALETWRERERKAAAGRKAAAK